MKMTINYLEFHEEGKMMQIKDLFEKDIFRPINNVVQAEQVEEDVVETELDEYVLTIFL